MICLTRFRLVVLLLAVLPAVHAAPDKVIKVLPHYLDQNGKHALSPSLFERDAYQALLRSRPDKRGGMQFDIQWKGRKAPGRALELRLELVTVNFPKGKPFSADVKVEPTGRFSRWRRIKLEKPLTDKLGEIIAWRVSLWEGATELSEQKSFLW